MGLIAVAPVWRPKNFTLAVNLGSIQHAIAPASFRVAGRPIPPSLGVRIDK